MSDILVFGIPMETKVVPVAMDIGWYSVPPEKAQKWAVYVRKTHVPRYGSGWFPAFDKDMNYMYDTQEIANQKLKEYEHDN